MRVKVTTLLIILIFLFLITGGIVFLTTVNNRKPKYAFGEDNTIILTGRPGGMAKLEVGRDEISINNSSGRSRPWFGHVVFDLGTTGENSMYIYTDAKRIMPAVYGEMEYGKRYKVFQLTRIAKQGQNLDTPVIINYYIINEWE